MINIKDQKAKIYFFIVVKKDDLIFRLQNKIHDVFI